MHVPILQEPSNYLFNLLANLKSPDAKGVKMDLLPVKYSAQKNAWMDTTIFHDWFHHTFVPYVCDKLSSLGLECKAVLVLDNCSAHPNVEELISEDGKISAKYLPPNVTSLIQPMDQGVLNALKLRYFSVGYSLKTTGVVLW